MVRHEKLADGHVKVTALANFTARVVRDLLLDDDAGGRRDFELEVELDGRRVRFVLPAAEFGRMAWVLTHIGRGRSSTGASSSTHVRPSSRCPVVRKKSVRPVSGSRVRDFRA